MKGAALTVLLGLVYLAVVGSAAALDAAVGLAAGAAIVIGRIRAGGPLGPLRLRRVAAVPRFVVGVMRELASGSLKMLLVLTGRKSWRNLGLVEVPIGERSPRGVVVSGLVSTAAPGGILIEVDQGKGLMLVHDIDASDPDALRGEMQRFYQEAQKQVFP